MITSCSVFLSEFSQNGTLSVAYYSHLVPVVVALFLGVYGLIKTKASRLSLVFFAFVASFSLWLVGDLITWTSPEYGPIIFAWSWLDYLNIIFFALGAYFFGVLAQENISLIQKALIIVVCVPAFVLTLSGNSVIEFYQPGCEVVENSLTTTYKLFSEWSFVVLMLLDLFMSWKKSDKKKRIQLVVILVALLAFFAVFSSTEYIATITNVYEINLYGLFILPVFLIAMVFSITSLDVFKIRFLGTQLLVYTLIIMVASQFLFLESSTDAALNIITLIATVLFSLMLLRNTKKELEARKKIEALAADLGSANSRLKELDKQKTEFVSFASHQLRSPLTAMKGYASLIIEGDYGQISDDLRKAAQIIFDSTKTLASVVDDYLNVSRIELGQMKFEFTKFDFRILIMDVVDELKPNIEKANLKIAVNLKDGVDYNVFGDREKLKQVVTNIIDNSTKYTPSGSINIELEVLNGNVRVAIKDTGIGIAKDVIPKLFSKFSRSTAATKTNTRGTGLGLYIAKEVIVAHKGKIWVESPGENMGSTFYFEIPIAS